ncbi:MAG: N-acylglucosamine 2-epimerase, partial [Planctomycetota bacterium]
MNQERLKQLSATYRKGLLEDTLPFWLRHSIDREHGGFQFCLDRDGSIIDTDKGVWTQCRFTWLLATLYNTVEPRDEWLDLARHGIEFIRKHCFDTDGRMFFQVTREGAPLRKRRYTYTESFGAIAMAAYARATGEEQAADQARELFRMMIQYGTTPGLIPPKVDPETRPSRSLGFPMIT